MAVHDDGEKTPGVTVLRISFQDPSIHGFRFVQAFLTMELDGLFEKSAGRQRDFGRAQRLRLSLPPGCAEHEDVPRQNTVALFAHVDIVAPYDRETIPPRQRLDVALRMSEPSTPSQARRHGCRSFRC